MPNVTADHGYAQLVDEIAGPRNKAAQAEYELTLAAALEPFSPAKHHSPAERRPLHLPAQVQAVAPPVSSPPSAVGEAVLVPRSLWPAEACAENDGNGWTARVRSRTTRTAVVEFTHARTPDGRPYIPVRLPLELLTSCGGR